MISFSSNDVLCLSSASRRVIWGRFGRRRNILRALGNASLHILLDLLFCRLLRVSSIRNCYSKAIFDLRTIFSIDIFTTSHEFFFFSTLRNRKIYISGELILVAIFLIIQIILFFVPSDRDIEVWIKASLYGFGIMHVVLALLSLLFMVTLKIVMAYQGRTWYKSRVKFRQVHW